MIHKNAVGKEHPFSRLLARDASFYAVICRCETVLPFAIERRLNACGVHLGSPNFFSSLGGHTYLGRGSVLKMKPQRHPNSRYWQTAPDQPSAKSRVALPRPLTS